LKDGWINTGDIGIYTFNDCLKIVGRSKDTIVLSNGENIEPIPIEAKLCESPLIDNCMVVGQDQKHLGVLIVPSVEGFRELEHSMGEEISEISENSEALEVVKGEVHRLISAGNGFKAFEHVHSVRLISKVFDVGDELTNTFKIKRHVIAEKYGDIISEVYGE